MTVLAQFFFYSALSLVPASLPLAILLSLIHISIQELTRGILEIANHNYEKRLDMSGHEEFREVADSFNRMAERLTEYCLLYTSNRGLSIRLRYLRYRTVARLFLKQA